MQIHTAQVRGRRIAWNRREVVQHGLNADAVVLDLDEEWRECDRIQAVLAGAGGPIRILAEGGRFNLPSALMEAPGAIRMCLMGHVGEAVRIVTAKEAAPLTVVESGETAGADPAPEQPDLWATLMEEVRKATEGAKTAAQSATRAEADLRAAAERGDFDGEDGKTPVRGVDYWTEADRKPIEDATLDATTAAGKADAAAATAAEGEAERKEAENARKASEQARKIAETGRVETEATRAANESKRTETFNSNLGSWTTKVDSACKKATDTASKAAQDAKTATDSAIAKTEEATQAAVAKADKATASATTAANKAEAAVAKLPLPLGNTLKGEVESTLASVHDAYPAPLVTAKVMGQSNQTTTKGANLFDVSKVSSATSNGITMSVEDGCIRLSGTNTAAGVNNIEIVAGLGGKGAIIAAGKYTATVEGISQASLIIQLKDNTFASLTKAKPSAVIDNRSEQSMTYFLFQIPQGVTVNEKVKVWFEKEDKSLKEPYTGGKPSPSPDYPQEITNLTKAEVITSGINICSDDKLLCGIGYNSGVPFNKYGMVAEFPYTQPSETSGIGAVLNTKKGVTYSIAYLGSAAKAAVGIAEYSGLEDVGDIANAVSYVKVSDLKKVSLTATVDGVMVFVLASQWTDGKTNLNTFNKEDMIISVGEPCGTYTPHQSKSTPIDLQGNELLSIPNGVRDEVLIDAEGNVSLIKRVAKYVVPENVYAQDEPNNFGVQLELNAVDGKYLHKQLCPENAKYNSKINWMTVWKEGNSWANLQEFKQWFIGTEFYYGTKNPETIPLGKVELPALPESTSNVWNDGNIPANVYINYLKDVNIAYSDLENQIKQITLALSVMDTPTITPEI